MANQGTLLTASLADLKPYGMNKDETRSVASDGEAGMKMRSSWKPSLAGMMACLALFDTAQAAPPAANLVSAPLVSPAAAWSAYGSATVHTNGIAAWSTLPPEMAALARTLGADRVLANPRQMDDATYTKNVFEYVRNNIDTEFRFGLGKGGRGALIDQSGTAFDQAELMVKLLRAANISASYKIGTINLTAQQFGQWTGLFATLNESAQTVTVNAQAACQLLADGAIPGSCSPATGNLTSITMGHIWVSANGNLYDPSFKPSTLTSGVDIPAAMGCGTVAASTCGAAMVSAAMTGAASGNTSVGGQSIPYVQNLNEAQLNNRLLAGATALQSGIESTNRLARLEEIVGGRRLTTSSTPAIGTTLAYVSSTQATWSGDIPDQFRTTLRVRLAFPYWIDSAQTGHAGVDRTFYGDELAGRRLQASGTPEQALRLDGGGIAANTCTTCQDQYVQLDVDHPYATAGYADESIGLRLYQAEGDNVNTPLGGTLPITIIHGWGNATSSTERHFAALQEILPAATHAYWELSGTGTITRVDSQYVNRDQPMLGVRLLVQAALADRITSGLAKTVITRHHSLGIAYAHPYSPSTLSNLSVQSALSVISNSNDATARSAAFETSASTLAALEGSVNQQLNSTDTGVSTSTLFWNANVDLPGKPRRKFLQMSSTQITAADPGTSGNYVNGLKSLAANGYGAVFPESGGAEILVKSNVIAHTIAGTLKGGAALSTDPVSKALNTIKVADLAAARKQYLSVSPVDGSATITQTDLVTGEGDFPRALPFQRSYSSGSSVLDKVNGSYSNTFNPSTESQTVSNTYTLTYSGPDSSANSHIGGGWNHNYNVTAAYTGNGAKALGQDYAIEASATIAALQSIYDAARSPSLSGRVSSMLADYWLAKNQWAFNSVVVDKGGASESFQRLPDGKFFTPRGSALLEQTGSQTLTNDFSPVTFKYTGKGGDTIDFSVALYSKIPQCCGAVTKAEPVFKADSWKFPDGTIVSFAYDGVNLVTSGNYTIYPSCTSGGVCPPGQISLPYGYVLRSVSNNLGRSLTFTTSHTTIQAIVATGVGTLPSAQNLASRFTITRVTDETGRYVTYDLSGCNGSQWACEKLTVTGPDGRASLYDYKAGTDSPDPAQIGRNAYRLRRWFTPSDALNAYRTLTYDEIFRVETLKDPLSDITTYYPGAVLASERWKRSETVSPLGAVTARVFDGYNNVLASIDPLGRTTTTTYDNANRKLKTINPEGDSVEQTYDVRSNVLTSIRRAKPGSGYADQTSSATYGEGATVLNCANWKTCNQPLTETDARTNTTTYAYSGTTGQLLKVSGPAVPLNGSNVAPLTTLCYTSSNGISLLTGRIDKVNATANRVRSFTYDAGNKYVLKTATADPSTTLNPPGSPALSCPTASKSGALNLVTTLSFDSVGNLASVDGARTDVSDITSYSFDKARRITKIAAPLGATTRYCYDADGLLRGTHRARVSGATDPNASTASTDGSCANSYPSANWQSQTREYWATGDLKRVQDAEGNLTQYAYDAEGRAVLVTDPDARRTGTVYDLAGQTLCTWKGWNSASAPTNCTWNPSTYASNGNAGAFRYAAYTYTNNGKQQSVQDANNNQTDYAYDGFDRLAFTLFADPATGNRCTVAATITASTTPGCSGGQTYEKSTYDNNGNRLSLRTRNGHTITQDYDAANRVKTKSVSGGTPALPTVTYAYDLLNEPTSLTSPAAGSIAQHSVAYDYDAAGGIL